MADIRRVSAEEFYGTDKKDTENVKVRRLPSDQFYSEQSNKHVLRPAPAPTPPQEGLGIGGSFVEVGKSYVRNNASLAQTMTGAGTEMVGNMLSQHPVDIAMDAASGLSAMSPLPLDDKAVGFVRENVLGPKQEAGTNQFLGAREASQKVFGPIAEAPILKEDPRIAGVEYLGDAPIGTKISKGMSDVGGALPSQTPTIAAGLAFGPTGARIVGGAIEGAAQYEQGLQEGLTQEQAFKEAAVVGGGVGLLSGLPFDDVFKGVVPKKLQGKIASFIRSGVLESGSEAAEGGLDPFGQIASGRRKIESLDDVKKFVSDVATGVWEETSVIPATFITGGIGGALGDRGPRKIRSIPPELTKEAVRLAAELEAETPNTPRYDPRITPGRPEDNTDLDELEPAIRDWLLNTSDQTTIKIKGKTYKGRAKVSEAPPQNPDDAIDVTATPVDALRPGPNAPNAYASFDEDNAPWVPQEPPVVAPEATNDIDAILDSLADTTTIEVNGQRLRGRLKTGTLGAKTELNELDKMRIRDAELAAQRKERQQQVAPEAPVEQLTPEDRALLEKYPELAPLYAAALQQPTAEQTALEQSILGQDLIDSREAKPPVEVRKPAPPLIEARPALDVGRPVEEQAPEPQTAREKFLARVSVRAQDRPRPGNRPTVTPEPTNVRATVRNMSQKGLQAEPQVAGEVVDPNIDYLRQKISETEEFLGSDGHSDFMKQEVFAPALQEYKDRLSAYEQGREYSGDIDPERADDYALLDRLDDAIDKYATKGSRTGRGDAYVRGSIYDLFGIPERVAEDGGKPIPSEIMRDNRSVRLGSIYLDEKMRDFDPTSEDNINKIAETIFKEDAIKNGLDPDALLSPDSGWTKEKQNQEVNKAKLKARRMLTQIRNEIFPEEPATTEPTQPAALPKPAATFRGMQPRPRGQEPIPLYNIPDGKGGQTTVSAETAAAQGYSVPEPPAEAEAPVPTAKEKLAAKVEAVKGASPVSASANRAAMPEQREGTNYEKTLGAIGDTLAGNKGVVADVKVDTVSGKMDLDEFEAKGYAPNEVTRSEWVSLQRANRRKLGQPEESGTKYAPYADYEEYHRADVERALAKGEEVDDRVLADYPDLATPTQPVAPTSPTIRAAALDIAGTPETRVRLADLREKLGGTREQQDAALLDMQKSGELVLMRNDDPQDITPRDEAAKLMLSGERRDLVYVKAEKPTTQEKVQALREKAKPKPKRTRKPKDTPPDITQQSMVEEESAYPESIQYDEEDVAYQYTQERLRKAFNVSTEDAQLLDAIISATGLNPKMLYVAAGSGNQRGVAGVSHSVKMGADRLRAAIIEGRSKSNTEAAIHEIAHAFRYILFDKDLPQSSRGNVTLDDIETARKWAGGKEGYNWGSEAEERFAQGFEKYLSTGKAPSSALERVFERLKQWIDKVYSTVIDKRYKARYDSISITPEMRDVFDRMLGKKEEAKKPKLGGDEAGYVNMGAIKEIGGIVFEAATKPVVFEQGFGQAKPAVAERRAKLKSFEMRGKHIAMDFDNGFRKLYKRLNPGLKGKLVNRFASIPDKIVNQLNDYLEQADPDMKAEALMELPPELRQPAVKMRELIDNMTDYMLSLGIVEDEQGMAFADNKGVYLRRTYDIFTDPDFRERRDPRLKETLRKWLQKEYPEYSASKIEQIITDLDGTGLSATSTNNMIARGKALGQMDRRTLGKREDIPQEVMDFWGVSRNGYDRFLDTINSQAHVIANYEFLSSMAENLDGVSVATASTLRDIDRGEYEGDNVNEINSWPYLNDADTARSIRRMSRRREIVSNKEQAIATALEKLGKLPDSPKKTEMVEKLRDDALMLKLGLKRDKAGVMSVDPENLEAAAAYLEALTAEVSSLGKKKGKDATKLRKDLDKYTRQYNKAEGEAATDENLPNMFGSFGPLAGARIHPDLKKALQDALAIKERSEFVDALRGINSQMKQNVTTRNPASAVRNLTSGFDFSMANGWILYGNSVKRLGEAMAIANVDISRNHDPKLREWYLRAAELGVAGDTVVIGDITATAANAKKPKKIRDFIRKHPEIAKAMGGPDAVAQKLYQAGDDVFKIFGWLTETEHLMDIGMSRKEAEVEAALRVRNQFPTYSELPKWAQWFKASPVVGPFVAYKTETYRTAYNTVVQAVTEVKSKDPKVRRMGYRRLAGIGAASISRNALKIMLFAAFAIDPDDEDAIQMAAPVFYQDHTLGIVKANKAKGLYEGYNLSTSDAYNVLKEPMYAALRGEGVGETVSNAAITIGRDYISPEMGASLIAELLANIQGKSSTIFKKSDTAGEKWLKSAMRVGLDVGVPGGARGFLKAETPEDMINETVTQFTGLKTIKIDMPNDLLYKARALTAIPREQATDVYKYLRAKDKDGANAEIAKVNQTRKEQFMVVHKAYRAYASAGTRTDLLDDALKQAGLSQKSINSVKYGMYEDWEGSKPMKEALGQ